MRVRQHLRRLELIVHRGWPVHSELRDDPRPGTKGKSQVQARACAIPHRGMSRPRRAMKASVGRPSAETLGTQRTRRGRVACAHKCLEARADSLRKHDRRHAWRTRFLGYRRRFIGNEPRFVSNEPRFVSNEPRLVANEPRLVANEPRFVSNESRLVANEPRFVSNESRFVSNEPRLIANEPRFVSNESRLVSNEPRLVGQ
jgi:hypothetical protein